MAYLLLSALPFDATGAEPKALKQKEKESPFSVLHQHCDPVASIVVSEDGSVVVFESNCRNGQYELQALDRTTLNWRKLIKSESPLSFQVSPDGKTIVAIPCTSQESIASVWSIDNGKIERTLEVDLLEGRSPRPVVAFSRDSTLLAVADSTGIRVWSVKQWEIAKRIKLDESPISAMFSKDGTQLHVGFSDRIDTWNLAGRLLWTKQIDPYLSDLFPDRDSGALIGCLGNAKILIMSEKDGSTKKTIEGRLIGKSASGHYIAVRRKDAIKIIASRTGLEESHDISEKMSALLYRFHLDPRKERVLTCIKNLIVEMPFALEGDNRPDRHLAPIHHLAIGKQGSRVAVSSDAISSTTSSGVKWHFPPTLIHSAAVIPATGEIWYSQMDGQVRKVSPDLDSSALFSRFSGFPTVCASGAMVAISHSGGKNQGFEIGKASDGTLKQFGRGNNRGAIATVRSGQGLFHFSNDHLFYYDTENGELKNQFKKPCRDVSPILSGSANGAVAFVGNILDAEEIGDSSHCEILDTATMSIVRKVARKQGMTSAACFSASGRIVAIGSENGAITGIDMASPEAAILEVKLHNPVSALCFSSDERTLLAATIGGKVEVLEVPRRVDSKADGNSTLVHELRSKDSAKGLVAAFNLSAHQRPPDWFEVRLKRVIEVRSRIQSLCEIRNSNQIRTAEIESELASISVIAKPAFDKWLQEVRGHDAKWLRRLSSLHAPSRELILEADTLELQRVVIAISSSQWEDAERLLEMIRENYSEPISGLASSSLIFRKRINARKGN